RTCDLIRLHHLAYRLCRDYVGLGLCVVSTVGVVRHRNLPGLGGYLVALERGESPPRELEEVDEATRRRERLMLGLRLDEPLAVASVGDARDAHAVERLERAGLAIRGDGPTIGLTQPGRFLGGGGTVGLLPDNPCR